MTLVVDASVVVAALIDSGPAGSWAEGLLATSDLLAPHLLPVEVASTLRTAALADRISWDAASLAQGDVMQISLQLLPYEPFADRVWELRHNVTPYDAWYVAVAESADAPLATLDARLAQAAGPRCAFTLLQ
jgi:predicted nucleic acid-binding protein